MADTRFSILTPVYETPLTALWQMLESVRAQSFNDWELLLVDDASAQPHIGELLKRATAADPRIHVHRRNRHGGFVASSNDALEMASGEFVALLGHDDELHSDALASVHQALLERPEADYVYTDEGTIDKRGKRTGDFFKPDWSPDRMRTQMYTCHLSVLRHALVAEVGSFDPSYEGAQDWDLVLKVTERARAVLHVPHVLYYRRMFKAPAAGGGKAAEPQSPVAGERAVQAHCKRIGLSARVGRDPSDPGIYHLKPMLTKQPSVSIIIPTRGQVREIRHKPEVLVNNCVRSIVGISTYDHYEIVVVVDATTPAGVIDDLRKIGGGRLRPVEYDRPFNFSAKINLGATRSEGDRLLLLNDDMEVITPNWIERMVMYSSMPDIGAVGGKLLWEDGRLQHVGVRFEQGLPGHQYRGLAGDFPGYANDVKVVQNCLAVTGACLMTRRDAFDEVGGFSIDFPVNYNDIDYCLKQRAAGRRVLYDPDLALYHFESSSRSSEVETWEKDLLKERWLPMTATDPYSNPNLLTGRPLLSSPFRWVQRRCARLGRNLPARPR